LFRNLGANAFLISDSDGAQTVSLAAGQARYFYLTDNTTSAGTWGNFTYGTGTSSADAASLAGAGLVALLGKLATSNTVVPTFSAPTMSETDRAVTYVWTGGVGTFTLPAAANINTGWYFLLRNNGTGALALTPQGLSTVNDEGNATFNPGDSAIVAFNKTSGNFYTIGLTNQNAVTLTASTYDVDSTIGNTLSLVGNAPNIQTYVALSGVRTQTLNVVLPAITQLYVINNSTNQAGYNVSFQVSGSAQTPVPVSTGTVALLLSDGLNIFTLTSVGASTFFAANGTAAAPSFSFLSNLSTGLFLKSSSVLGVTAGGVEMIAVDNSNPALPRVDVSATLIADLIAGGTF
jgi:hypothetical protein